MDFFLPPRIIFLRHGETDWNVEYRLQGQRDTPLNGRGRDQARAVGRRLRDYFGDATPALDDDLDFVASPLSRARHTMELARAAMGLDPERYRTDESLVELSFGAWEGLTWDELKAQDPLAAHERERDKWRYQPPGGESYAMLAARVEPWLQRLQREAFVVSHGGVARVLMAMIGGMPIEKAPMAEIKQGRALIFDNGASRWL